MRTSSRLSSDELEERERMVAGIQFLLAICASEIRFAEDQVAAKRRKPLPVAIAKGHQIDLRAESVRCAREDLAEREA